MVPAGMVVLVVLAALVPALRAGRLPAVAAIAAGQAPRAGHGYGAHRLAGRLPLPRPVTVGLAAPFTRPSRTAATLAAILFGVTAVILAVGLDSSLAKVNEVSNLGWGQVQVLRASDQRSEPPPLMTSSQRKAVEAALKAQPGTLRYVAEALGDQDSTVTMPALPHLAYMAYTTDSSWLGYQMLSGHWYSRPGEVDVNSSFLIETGLKVGDSLTVSINRKPATLRIAGEVYYPNTPFLFTSWQALGGTAAGLAPLVYNVGLKPGVSVQSYLSALSNALVPGFTAGAPARRGRLQQPGR
jgi:putative ABC transport system permease protein